MYLMTDTKNPTPHEIILPGFQDPAEIDRAIETLERRKVPLVYLVRVLIGAHGSRARICAAELRLRGGLGVPRRASS